jgi:hypothetical protein
MDATPDTNIVISITHQRLSLFIAGHLLQDYAISTAKNGVGQQNGSGCTPLGEHTIRAKVGTNSPIGTVFLGRRPTGEVFNPESTDLYPTRDWILTRILWLTGREHGLNRCGSVDTLRRYIYIHGCPDDAPMGIAESHGCIRMRNADGIDLFDRVIVGTAVRIEV